MKVDFSDLSDRICIEQGDANDKVRVLCSGDWQSRRAVLFLDPYGLQVEWTTLEAVAKTKAIDLWLLFPLGMAVNRMLPSSGHIPEPWRRRLDLLFGTRDWYDEFYRLSRQQDLFGDPEPLKTSIQHIGQYFNQRLKTIFADVAPKPGVLYNSTKCPLYLLCFAVSNPSSQAQRLSLRIANHLLKGLPQWPTALASNGPKPPGTR